MSQKIISPKEAKQILDNNEAILIDVREIGEYEAEHIDSAVNKPLSTFDKNEVEKLANGKKIIVQCLSGKRASQACAKIDNIDAMVLEDGINGWKKKGFETVKKGLGITIQRQVMIVAGLLILLGSLLTIYVDFNFIALPLFIGVGLIFAGLTGWCGMAILLNKMPWNK